MLFRSSCEECAYLARPVMLPRPDSGIDAAALAEALSDFRREREQHATAPWATDEAVAYIVARLSTPRTESPNSVSSGETSEPLTPEEAGIHKACEVVGVCIGHPSK